MKTVFGLFFLLAITSSCYGQINAGKEKASHSDQIEDITREIEDLTGKKFGEHSVMRFVPSDSIEWMMEQVDSVIAGKRLKGVDYNTAYEISERYFDQVKALDHYLYLTHLHFDEALRSYYDIAIVPQTDPLEVIRMVGTTPYNYGLSNADVIEWFRQRQQEFDFYITVVDEDRLEANILTEPESYEALGKAIYEFCPDVIEQGHDDMKSLVDFLKESKSMWFWWD